MTIKTLRLQCVRHASNSGIQSILATVQSQDVHLQGSRVLWTRARNFSATETETSTAEAPKDEVYPVPDSLSDDLALCAGIVATSLSISKIIASGAFTSAVVITTADTSRVARCISRLVLETLCDFRVTLIAMDETNDGFGGDVYHPSEVANAAGQFECCVDLCCTTDSLNFGFSCLHPLGTLIACTDEDTGRLELDMNAVVVNELELRFVGRVSAQVPDALAWLEVHGSII